MRAVVLCSLLCSLVAYTEQFSIPNLSGGGRRPFPALQVGRNRKAFLGAGTQLISLNTGLENGLINREEQVILSSRVVNISLNSGGERLVVCTDDGSCAVYNADDLSATPSFMTRPSTLPGVLEKIALFTAGNSFYVGNHDPLTSTIRLSQIDGIQGASNFVRSSGYTSEVNLTRDFFGGFVSGSNAYYIVSDHNPTDQSGIKVMRVCDVTGCPDGSSACGFSALYEETIVCGNRSFASQGDGVCGVSLIENFADVPGTSIVISRCQQNSLANNVVCLVPLAEVDRVMDTRYGQCSSGTGTSDISWRSSSIACPDITFTDTCDISEAIGASGSIIGDNIQPIDSFELISIGDDLGNNDLEGRGSAGSTITASIAVKIDGFSLVMVAYRNPDYQRNYIGLFNVSDTNARLTLDNVYNVGQTYDVRTLQWQPGLDYVLSASDLEVRAASLDGCGNRLSCSGCISSGNPLCGWCVDDRFDGACARTCTSPRRIAQLTGTQRAEDVCIVTVSGSDSGTRTNPTAVSSSSDPTAVSDSSIITLPITGLVLSAVAIVTSLFV